MANSKQGLIAGFSGQIGEVVIYQMMGKTVIRSLPTRKRAPAKGALKKSQDGFARMMKIMQAVKPFIKAGFHDVAEGRTAFHTALSENIKRRSQSNHPDSLHWLKVSSGKRAGANDLTVQCEGNSATVSWGPTPAGKISSIDDSVLLLALNTTTLDCTSNLYAASRKKGEALLELPMARKDEEVLVFVAFRSITSAVKKSVKNFSESQVIIVNC
jgi:hypothetical protein